MFQRIRTLWKLSGMEIEKDKTIQRKIKETLTGKKEAVIVETAELPDLFSDHETPE